MQDQVTVTQFDEPDNRIVSKDVYQDIKVALRRLNTLVADVTTSPNRPNEEITISVTHGSHLITDFAWRGEEYGQARDQLLLSEAAR